MSHLWVLLENDVFGVGKKKYGSEGDSGFLCLFFCS